MRVRSRVVVVEVERRTAAGTARREGYGGAMAASLLAIVVDCRDALAQATWWATVLGHEVSERNTDEYEVSQPSSGRSPLYFMNVPEPKTVKNRLHIDVTVDESLEDGVARLVALGAKLVDLRQDPETLANPDTWAVMQDPEGNEFCVFDKDTVTGLA
jgi:hypothetical protein